MSRGSFQEFTNALLDFESGWDRRRYDLGQISDEQLNTWARGTVADFFDGYTSWSQLSSDEWLSMASRSMNSLGFVGFQFGEALLIDLGYYQDDQYYLNGESENLWDGSWVGRNGVNSLDDFMNYDVQEMAICEAFGYNLFLLDGMLSRSGQSTSEYVGQVLEFQLASGATIEVQLTMTGILAAAHLRGATGVRDLLQRGVISEDEYGTSILTYVNQFGGFDSPPIDELVSYWRDPTPNPFGSEENPVKGDQWICVMTPSAGERQGFIDEGGHVASSTNIDDAAELRPSRPEVNDPAAQDGFHFIQSSHLTADDNVLQTLNPVSDDRSQDISEIHYSSDEFIYEKSGVSEGLRDLYSGQEANIGWELLLGL
ncbi:hypothetical protein [Phaeobacter sp. B1627]|uniref:hypothetical protein n=1 Tax=Phaeobacter sp. B1627 TaxID=2583809 RepID=UPI001119D288|nr:hypothetical protein [Phaeobacter sp. B1627]TNJ40598.1 hypothetical protein FGE21_17170 [Phaeobacter sp. B1627]